MGRRLKFEIRQMTAQDVAAVAHAFAHFGKTLEQYERYFAEQQRGERLTLLALADGRVIGYGNIIWRPAYEPFRRAGVPEINDLNVIEEARRCGVGTAVIREAERLVAARGITTIGIGVGLTPEYAAAQKLYPKLGYVSDRRGVHSNPPWDDAVYMTKKLNTKPTT
jgi:GNAT superfamily N-acetyltransferase